MTPSAPPPADAAVPAAAHAAADAPAAVGRATAVVTVWNLVSRITGFGRVVAVGAALGATALGDTYQAANLVSNVLFELLAGGMLSVALVPVFVQRLAGTDADGAAAARRLAANVLGVAGVALGAVVAIAMLLAPMLMRVLTSGVADPTLRDDQVGLGTFLLLFFLPQVLLYAVGAVSSALLNARRRFAAAAAAPVVNNVIVVITMVAFAALADDGGLDPGTAARVVLAVGTTLGVLAMTAVPWWALRRDLGPLVPRLPVDDRERAEVADVVRRGVWAAGPLGASQLLVAATVVLAGAVTGGVVAYQVAFTFFLLPHAILAHPVLTTTFPRLAAHAAADDLDPFVADLRQGFAVVVLAVAPASAALAVLARPTLQAVRLGNLDEAAAGLVAVTLAGYALGLAGYSCTFLFTRALYALGDVRTPTAVAAASTGAALVALAVVGATVDGWALLVVLGLVHTATVSVSAAALAVMVARRAGRPLRLSAPAARGVAAAAAAALGALPAAALLDGSGRLGASVQVAVGLLVAGVAVLAVARATGGIAPLSLVGRAR